jgi:hypothetical protein
VPLRFLNFGRWSEVVAQNNALRAERGMAQWSDDDSWALWQAFFLVRQ